MTASGLLFDLDGVLVESAPLHLRAYQQVFREAKLRFSNDAREAVLAGRPRSEVIEIATPGASGELRTKLAAAKPGALRQVLDDAEDCTAPGARQTVRALLAAGVPVAVVTNSATPEPWLRLLDVRVSVVVDRRDVTRPKPSPEGYLLAARRLDLPPERCLVVEDSEDGWRAAIAAGMQAIVVAPSRPLWIDAATPTITELEPARALRWVGA
jgi:HAD superfamily hydrolase (TIGR01509 family)